MTEASTGNSGKGALEINWFYATLFFFCPCLCFRTYESPRFSSELRSVVSVAIWTGSAASLPSQRFSSSGEACTRRPSRVTGMPDLAQRCTAEIGSPRKVAIWRHPLRAPDSGFVFALLGFAGSLLDIVPYQDGSLPLTQQDQPSFWMPTCRSMNRGFALAHPKMKTGARQCEII